MSTFTFQISQRRAYNERIDFPIHVDADRAAIFILVVFGGAVITTISLVYGHFILHRKASMRGKTYGASAAAGAIGGLVACLTLAYPIIQLCELGKVLVHGEESAIVVLVISSIIGLEAIAGLIGAGVLRLGGHTQVMGAGYAAGATVLGGLAAFLSVCTLTVVIQSYRYS